MCPSCCLIAFFCCSHDTNYHQYWLLKCTTFYEGGFVWRPEGGGLSCGWASRLTGKQWCFCGLRTRLAMWACWWMGESPWAEPHCCGSKVDRPRKGSGRAESRQKRFLSHKRMWRSNVTPGSSGQAVPLCIHGSHQISCSVVAGLYTTQMLSPSGKKVHSIWLMCKYFFLKYAFNIVNEPHYGT